MEELFTLLGKIIVENSEANANIDETTKKAEGGSSAITSAFKKIGGAVATYFAVDKIIDFGKQCVESAAEIQAQTAQFEASFKELQGAATEAFERVAEETGIFSTRLQTEGTKAFSMFKGAGMDANDALVESERFLKLAADAAAYYDISLEEASARVLGFIKGNFENGDAIGVFTNETQRNAIAMEKYGKKFSELTEAQKQALSLDMIENTYEMSGVLEQASREADGYENVMGNLREAWRQFMGVIGSPLLKAVIPIIQGMSNAILQVNEYLPTMGDGFKVFLLSIVEWLQPLIDKLNTLFTVISISWQFLLPHLQKAWETFSETLKVAWDNILSPIFDFLKQVLVDVVDIAIQYIPQISLVFGSMVDTLSQYWEEVLKPLFELIGIFIRDYLLPLWEENWERIKGVVSKVFDAISSLWFDTLKPILDAIIEFLGGVFTGNWEQAWNGLINIVSSVFTGMWNAIMTILDLVWQVVVMAVDNVKNSFDTGLSAARDLVVSIFTGIFNTIKEKIEAARKAVKDAIEKIKGYFKFEWSLPKLKMPRIKITGGWSFNPPSVPSFGIDWYAKGGILEKPTVFGINPMTGNAMVGGEAGREAVAPISELMSYVRTAVSESNNGVAEILLKILDVLSDDDRLKAVIIDALLNGNFKVELDNREVGRVVKAYA